MSICSFDTFPLFPKMGSLLNILSTYTRCKSEKTLYFVFSFQMIRINMLILCSFHKSLKHTSQVSVTKFIYCTFLDITLMFLIQYSDLLKH